jgi:hypothetical protein
MHRITSGGAPRYPLAPTLAVYILTTGVTFCVLPGSCFLCCAAFMQCVFDYMHSQGVREGDLRRVLADIPLAPGMPEVSQHGMAMQAEAVLVSA